MGSGQKLEGFRESVHESVKNMLSNRKVKTILSKTERKGILGNAMAGLLVILSPMIT